MDTVALISGGKDSCLNMMHCAANGYRIVALANLFPGDDKDEVDSFMYQSVGHDIIPLYSECMGIPLFRRKIGKSLNIINDYTPTEGDEVEDLFQLLSKIITELPNIKFVSVGAILSNYQRIRVENVCKRLNLTCLSFLWMRDQSQLLNEMIESGLHSVVIKVACQGLTEKNLGMSLSQIQPHLLRFSYLNIID